MYAGWRRTFEGNGEVRGDGRVIGDPKRRNLEKEAGKEREDIGVLMMDWLL